MAAFYLMKRRQKIRRGLILFSFFLFPAIYYYFSPYLIIDATSKNIINGSFIVFSLLFISAFIVGRGYCGWVCPGAGCQEAIATLRNNKVIKGKMIKWIIWIPWIVSIIVVAVRKGGYQKVDLFYRTTYGLSINDVDSLIRYLIVLALIAVPAFVIGKRSFCHHICWMAPFMIIGGKIRDNINSPSLKLVVNKDNCKNCHTCTDNCPMSLPVEDMVQNSAMRNSDCILCGTCVDGCKQETIKYSFK
jgi:polyferredoxin